MKNRDKYSVYRSTEGRPLLYIYHDSKYIFFKLDPSSDYLLTFQNIDTVWKHMEENEIVGQSTATFADMLKLVTEFDNKETKND